MSSGGWARALIVFGVAVLAAPASAQLCDPAADPCVVTGTVNVPGDSSFDLGTRNLVLLAGSTLNVQATGLGSLLVMARNITLQTNARIIAGGVNGNGGQVTMIASEAFFMQSGSRIDATAGLAGDINIVAASATIEGQLRANGTDGFGDGGFVDITTTGNVLVAGTGIQVTGGNSDSLGGFVFVSAGGNLEVRAPIDARGGSGGDVDLDVGGNLLITTAGIVNNIALYAANDGGDVAFSANGNVEIRGQVLSRGQGGLDEGGGWGGDFDILAHDVILAAQIELTGAGPDGDGGFLDVNAEGDILMTSPIIATGAAQGGGGEVDFFAGGRVDVQHTIDVRGGFVGGVFDAQARGAVAFSSNGRIDATFIPGFVFGGYGGIISVLGCDVTVPFGALLDARGIGDAPRAGIHLRSGNTMTIAGSLQATSVNSLLHLNGPPTIMPSASIVPAATIAADEQIPCCVGCPTTTSTTTTTSTSSSSTTTTSTSTSSTTSTSNSITTTSVTVPSTTSTSSSSTTSSSTASTSSSSTTAPPASTTTTSTIDSTTTTTLPLTCLDEPLVGYDAVTCALGELQDELTAQPDETLGGRKNASRLIGKVLKAGTLIEKSRGHRKQAKLLAKAQKKLGSFATVLQRLVTKGKVTDQALVDRLLGLSSDASSRIEGVVTPPAA